MKARPLHDRVLLKRIEEKETVKGEMISQVGSVSANNDKTIGGIIAEALQNAASIAALLLTTEALVSEIKEDKKASAMPSGGGMGDMY